jgi:hypothetical protein
MLIATYIWPFTNVEHRFHRGYGDFNTVAGGFHKGIDVYSPTSLSMVQAPFENALISKVEKDPLTDQWSILLVQGPYSPMGLLYQHIVDPIYYKEEDVLEYEIGMCYDSIPPPLGFARHVHIANFDPNDWPPPNEMLIPKGYGDVSPNFYVPEHGIVFAPITLSANPNNLIAFFTENFPAEQFYLRKAVDFRVAPSSTISGSADDCSTGVRSLVLNSIDRMNPISDEYETNVFYEPRIVFNWSNELEDRIASYAECSFLYGSYLGGQQFDMSYVCTNTSVIEDVGDYGIGNIWTEPYNAQQDFDDSDPDPSKEQIRCRGAWDTILSIDRNDDLPENLGSSEICVHGLSLQVWT